jgi:hypothetical protein
LKALDMLDDSHSAPPKIQLVITASGPRRVANFVSIVKRRICQSNATDLWRSLGYLQSFGSSLSCSDVWLDESKIWAQTDAIPSLLRDRP